MKRRKQIGFQLLEQRFLLAAGLIPLDLTIPLSSVSAGSAFQLDGSAIIRLKAMVLNPKASEPSDVSLTGYDFIGSGNFAGPIEGLVVTGTFSTDAVPTNNAPSIPIAVHPATKTIDLVLTQFGTFDATSDAGPILGAFSVVAELTLDFNTRGITGRTTSTFAASGREEINISPVQLPNALPADIEFPDATKPSISGRVFDDADGDGLRGASELGVEGIRAIRLSTEGAAPIEVESIASDANGYYSFYNLDGSASAIRYRDLPLALDFGKMGSGGDPTLDSDADSLSGTTEPIVFTAVQNQLNVDAGLRTTPFEWQNPNVVTDVNNDGNTTAGDALAIINLLSRLQSGANSADLSGNRPPDELFYDVDGNGRSNAADALAVIFGLYSEEFGSSEEGEAALSLDWLSNDKTRPFPTQAEITASESKLF